MQWPANFERQTYQADVEKYLWPLLWVVGWIVFPKTIFYLFNGLLARFPKRQNVTSWKTRLQILFPAIVLAYLSLNVFLQGYRVVAPALSLRTWHTLLELPPGISDSKAVRRALRRVSLKLHPDKVGIVTREAVEVYEQAQLAAHVLADDNRRWAYERFGPAVTENDEFKLCSNWEDYLLVGVKNHCLLYGSIYGSVQCLRLFSLFNGARKTLSSLLPIFIIFHVILLFSSKVPNWYLHVFPGLLSFQFIEMARLLLANLSMAANEIAWFQKWHNRQATAI